MSSHVSLGELWRSAVLEDLPGDLEARILEVHDGVRDLDPDRVDHGLDVEGAHEPVREGLDVFWKKFKQNILTSQSRVRF